MLTILPMLLGAIFFSLIGDGIENDSDDEAESSADDGSDNNNEDLSDMLGYSAYEESSGGSSPMLDIANEPVTNEQPSKVDTPVGEDAFVQTSNGYSDFEEYGSDADEFGEASNIAVFDEEGDLTTDVSGSEIFSSPLDSGSPEVDPEVNIVNNIVQSSTLDDVYLGNDGNTFVGLSREPSGDTDANLRSLVVYGGVGNDFIIGEVSEEHLLWAHGNDQGFVSFEHDTLNGGAGNDTLVGSHGDLLVGGAGEDVFEVVLNHGNNDDPAQIADFVRGEDFLELRYGEGNGYEISPEFFQTITHQSFIHTVSPCGNTVISDAEGNPLLEIMGVENLTIGLAQWNGETGTYDIVDLNGSLVSEARLDVLIKEQSSMFGLV